MELQKQNETFTIMQLTDLHVGAMPFDQLDQYTFNHIRQMTELVNPELIVISGDLIWSEGVRAPEKSFDALLDVLNGLQKPITITYGNHDSEEGITRSQLREMEGKLDRLVDKKHLHIVEDRASYCIEIKDTHGKVAHVLYLIDSGALDPLQFGTYEYVHPEQVSWFNEVSKSYSTRNAELKQDLLFLHIPLPEYEDAYRRGQVSGQKKERISSPELNIGLFASLMMNGQIAGIFCGHDHDNDFVAEYAGIRFCYGRVSGFNTYGELTRGARVIELWDDAPFETHIVETEQYKHYRSYQ